MNADLTVSAGQIVDLAGTVPSDLHILHHIAGATSGGYVSVRVCTKRVGAALNSAPKHISAMSRVAATDIVTATSTAHGLSVGDIAVIRGAGTFNGEFQVATVADADTFTFLQEGANEGPVVGLAYRIPTVPYNGEGVNLPSAATAAGYDCRIANFNGLLWVQCNITDGTHNVYLQDARGGTGATSSQGVPISVTGNAGNGSLADIGSAVVVNGRGIINLSVENGAGAALTNFAVLAQAHPSAAWQTVLSGTDFATATAVLVATGLSATSQRANTLAASESVRLQLNLGAPYAVKFQAQAGVGSHPVTIYGNAAAQ